MKKIFAFFVMAAILLVSCNNTESSSSKESKGKDSKEVKADPIIEKLNAIEKAIDAGNLEKAEDLMDEFEDSVDEKYEPTVEHQKIIDRINEKYNKLEEEMYGDFEEIDDEPADDWED